MEKKTNDSYKYLYIQMELCREENLAKWLKTRQSVELNVPQMFREILSAVEYLHSKVIISINLCTLCNNFTTKANFVKIDLEISSS